MKIPQASRRFRTAAALGAVFALGGVGVAAAQDIPEGQSCGGLVCDLGLFGHKVPPKAAATPPATVESVSPKPRAEAPPRDEAPSRRKHKVAKAVAAPRGETRAQGPSTRRPADKPAISLAAPVSAIPMPPAGAAAPLSIAVEPPPAPVVTAPAPDAPVVMANPYVYTRPLPFMFQSVDPTQSVQ